MKEVKHKVSWCIAKSFAVLALLISFYFCGLLVGKVQAAPVLLDDFETWRNGYCGDMDKLFDVYNGATGDAGPNQSVLSITGNTLPVLVPAGNVWYVDQDDAAYTSTNCWMKGHIKSGTWDPDINRMVFWFVQPLVAGLTQMVQTT
jgi:hypothetical protein